MFHTPNTHLVPLQAEAAGLPLVAVETEGIEEAELADLTRAIRLAVEQHGIEGVVTGALLSVYQATRVQRICRDLDLWCFNPLWYTDPEHYMKELIATGSRAIITGVFAAPFSADWLGREIDREALIDLQQYVRSTGSPSPVKAGGTRRWSWMRLSLQKGSWFLSRKKSMRISGDSCG